MTAEDLDNVSRKILGEFNVLYKTLFFRKYRIVEKEIKTVFLVFLFLCSSTIINKGFCLDDPSCHGNPGEKIDWHQGLDGFQGPDDPETVFEIDGETYWIKSKTIHGTEVLVAIHKSLTKVRDINGFSIPTPGEFANHVFKYFDHHFHVFGGFPYNRYTVKVKSSPGFSLSRVGIAIGSTSSDISPPPNFPPHTYAKAFEGFVPHEMFHAWLGKLIQSEPNTDGRLFQLETWIHEGTTSYYGDRAVGITNGKSRYKKLMSDKLKQYHKVIGTMLDLSIEDITTKIGEGPPANNEEQAVLYARATLINYMLDIELAKLGLNLDLLLRALYNEFGLTGKKWKQEDIPRILKDITGNDFNNFFNEYLYTNTKLPLKNKFKFILHEGFECKDK